MNRPRLIGLAALGALALAVAVVAVRVRGPRVEVGEASRRTIVPAVSGSGRIVLPGRVDVAARVIGRVAKIGVAVGDRVRRGEVVAELDGTSYATQAREAGAAAARAAEESSRSASALEAAARKFDRALTFEGRRLASNEFLQASRLDVERARAAHDAASAALASARKQLASAREALARTRIVATLDGEVAAVRVKAGETVTERTPIVSVTDHGVSIAAVEVRADAAGAVVPGEIATVLPGGAKAALRGEVREVRAPNKSGDSAYVTVMIAVGPTDSDLRPGAYVRVRIEGRAKPGALAVPLSSLVPPGRTRRRRAGVFIPDGGRARWREVVVGVRGDRFAEIVAGLREGEMIVVGPAGAIARLADGDRIRAGRKEE